MVLFILYNFYSSRSSRSTTTCTRLTWQVLIGGYFPKQASVFSMGILKFYRSFWGVSIVGFEGLSVGVHGFMLLYVFNRLSQWLSNDAFELFVGFLAYIQNDTTPHPPNTIRPHETNPSNKANQSNYTGNSHNLGFGEEAQKKCFFSYNGFLEGQKKNKTRQHNGQPPFGVVKASSLPALAVHLAVGVEGEQTS